MSTLPRTLGQVAAYFAQGGTSTQLTEAFLERITGLKGLNAMVTVTRELALEQAAASDARRIAGTSLGIFDGVPYTLKDVFCVPGVPTTASSRYLSSWTPPYESTVARKLREAGAILLGMTNTDEFTMGASTETAWPGVTHNPWDTSKVPGGSSGGSAAAVAAGLGVFSIGTDTAGSIRHPSAFCGVTGVRPTYGRISRYGEIAMASSLDQAGPICHTIEDAAAILTLLAGPDERDATSLKTPVPSYELTGASIAGMRVGIPKEYFGEGLSDGVRAVVNDAVEVLKTQGAEIVEVSIPEAELALPAYYVLCPAEVSSNMARYDGVRYGHRSKADTLAALNAMSRSEGIGAEVQRRIMLGTHVLSAGSHDAYFAKSWQVRDAVVAAFERVFAEVDVLVSPTTPHTAFAIGAHAGDPVAMYLEDVLVVPVNIGEICGLSVPCGLVDGMPAGLQVMAARDQDATMLRVAHAYQQVTSWHELAPEV